MEILYTARGKYDKDNIDNFSWNKYKDWTKMYQLEELVSLDGLLNELINNLQDFDIPTNDKVLAEIQYIGYATSTDNCDKSICIVSNIDDSRTNPIITLYFLNDGKSKQIKIKSKLFTLTSYLYAPFMLVANQIFNNIIAPEIITKIILK